jgi:hypothetical protein
MVDFRRAPQLLIRTASRASAPHLLNVPGPRRGIPMEQPNGRSPLALTLNGHATRVVERQ